MTYYKQMGKIPRKRHTVMRNEEGSLYREQVMGTKGFSGIQSILYHHHSPTEIVRSTLLENNPLVYEEQSALRPRHLQTDKVEKGKDALTGSGISFR